jgi:hypothetical protein
MNADSEGLKTDSSAKKLSGIPVVPLVPTRDNFRETIFFATIIS